MSNLLSVTEAAQLLGVSTKWYGSKLIVVNRFYPSSKTCSHCGFIHKELSLKERVFVCPNCSFSVDRDLLKGGD